MKTSMKAIAGLVLVAGALVASGTVARAGEGGTAGSVALKFSTGLPTSSSTSIAVGKNGGASSSRTDATNTFTSAVGANGAFSLTNGGSTSVGYALTAEAGGPGSALTINQANSLGGVTAKINNPGNPATPTVSIP
jgi:hypothetical protein